MRECEHVRRRHRPLSRPSCCPPGTARCDGGGTQIGARSAASTHILAVVVRASLGGVGTVEYSGWDASVTTHFHVEPSSCVCATRHPKSNACNVCVDMLTLPKVARGAWSYDLCCVAAGRVEGFFEYGLSPWDTAAASLIIKEAGGVVSDWNGGVDWLFGKRIIAGNKAISSFLKDEIQDVFTSSELTE